MADTYTPLTPEQFASAKKAGFSSDQIIKNEQIRKSKMTVAAPEKSTLEKVGDAAGGVVNFINNNPISKGLTSLAALPVQLGAKALGQKDPFAEGIGTGFGSVKPADVTTYQGKTDEQYRNEEIGNAAQVGSLFFPYGRAAGLAEKGLAPIVGKTLGGGLAKVASGAAGGYGVDVASNLQSGKPIDQSLSPGAGTAIGAALPIVGPAVGAVARGAGESLGVSTGAGYGAIKEAFNAASAGGERAKAYTDALRGKTLPEDIVDEAKSSLGQIISDRSKNYQQQLSQVAKDNTKSFDISPVQKKLDSMLGDFNVEKTDTGALDFSRSPGLGRYKQDLTDIQDVLDNWGSKPGDRTVVGIDKLKQTLDDFRRGTADSRKFDSFVTALRNSAKDIIAKEPGYAKLVGDYGEKTGLIKEIQKGLSLGDKASIDTGFRKLTTALRTNNEFRKELIAELDKASGGFLSSKVAGQQLSEALPRGLAKQIEGFGAIGAVASGVGIIPLLKVAAFASPRVVGEIVNALGISKKVFTQLLDHLGAQKAQFPGDRVIDEAGPAVKNYFEKNPPSLGLSMKDVSGGVPSVPKALGGAPKDAEAFAGFEDVSTKVLNDLKGRTTVSKQYVLDALNRADIKQAEKDIIKPILDQEGPTIKVRDFANKIKAELLPLERGKVQYPRYDFVSLPDDLRGPVRNYAEHVYQSPLETGAGRVHFADTGVESNNGINSPKNYFAHSRTEDLSPQEEWGSTTGLSDTRRVIEAQSDLFQKGNLDKEFGEFGKYSGYQEDPLVANFDYSGIKVGKKFQLDGAGPNEETFTITEVGPDGKFSAITDPKYPPINFVASKNGELFGETQLNAINEKFDAQKKLNPYKNTWQDRIVREEVRQAAKDGIKKLQFPTGDTAMKIEGLAGNEGVSLENAGSVGNTFEFQGQDWQTVGENGDSVTAVPLGRQASESPRSFTLSDVKNDRAMQLADDGGRQLYDELNNSAVLKTIKGDPELQDAYDYIFREGKYKGSPSLSDDEAYTEFSNKFDVDDLAHRYADEELKTREAAIEWLDGAGADEAYSPAGNNDFEIIAYDPNLTEQIPLGDGSIDPSHPIHKYYEKELGKFLKNKYNAEVITDDNGVSWYQINVPEAAAKEPVQAFGKAKIGALVGGAAASAAGVGALAAKPQPLNQK